jgi:YggT family protein
MFALGNLLIALTRIIEIINFLLSFYIYVIIFRALISWVNPDPYNPVVLFLHRSTEPVLNPIRHWLIRIFRREMWMDISPIIAIFAIWILQIFLKDFVGSSLIDLAIRLKS